MTKLAAAVLMPVFALLLTACTANAGAPHASNREPIGVLLTQLPAVETLPDIGPIQPSAQPVIVDNEPDPEDEVEFSQQEPETIAPVFTYPDAVRGIYVTGHSAGGSRLAKLLKLVDETELNAMVIDVKDDLGYITFQLPDSPLGEYSRPLIKDPVELLQTLAEHQIYPIARIVVFKDTVLADKYPEYSFVNNTGKVWRNNRGEAFVSPFITEVWDHNIAIAKEAARLGFQEIQFDYVRFPEGFEKRDQSLIFSMGDYTEEQLLPRLLAEWEQIPADSRGDKMPVYDAVQARVTAVTDFVRYASEQLRPLDVKVSVDIFGYTVTVPEAPGIGQNFVKISEHVDVISSMIYPSHWGPGYFKIAKPDTEPYRLVNEYMDAEMEKLALLAKAPISRPWLQDFSAPWLGTNNYLIYGKNEVEEQIRALNQNGIKEFLLWNAGNIYSPGVDYTPVQQILAGEGA